MSKEKTPITEEELYISIADILGRHWGIDVENTKKCVEIAEQYAQAKVLEALEEKSKTAESILGTLNDMHSNDEISYDRYTYLFEKVASIQLDETEVKPKYE